MPSFLSFLFYDRLSLEKPMARVKDQSVFDERSNRFRFRRWGIGVRTSRGRMRTAVKESQRNEFRKIQ